MIHDGAMDVRYHDVIDSLRAAYDSRADWRDSQVKAPWKLAERAAFLDRLHADGCRRLLEVGAGTGQDSEFFKANSLDVVAVDLSPAMVACCRGKGVEAYVRDVLQLGFLPESFDAGYALNCLLHVPNRDLPTALEAIKTVLRPGGLFFLGVYGAAEAAEGPLDGDGYEPPRFFSWRTDEQLQQFAGQSFDIVDFHVLPIGEIWFQSLTLRRPR
jgi:SAM-dependent methyltransferase